MADFADVASDIEQDRLNHSLAERVNFQGESEEFCMNCGNEIPPQRRALGNVKLCIDCQTHVEGNSKHYRGGGKHGTN